MSPIALDELPATQRYLRARTVASKVWLFGARYGHAGKRCHFLPVLPDDADAEAVDRAANDAARELSASFGLGIDVVTITCAAFYYELADLHPSAVRYACRAEGRRFQERR